MKAEDLGAAEALVLVSIRSLSCWLWTYVVGLAARGCREVCRVTESCVEGLNLLLCACILPVGTERVTESALPLALRTTFELLKQRLSRIEIRKQVLSIMAPENSSMLHTSTRNALHF